MRDTVRAGSSLTQAFHLVLLVRLEVTFEPVPFVRMFLSPLPGENVSGDAVKEPTIVGDDHRTTREFQ